MKLLMLTNFNNGMMSSDCEENSDMYFAMYAYEMLGDATRDNTFQELVILGRKLETKGGAE